MSEKHRKQATFGFGQALVAANYIEVNLDALNIIKGSKGKYLNIKNTQMTGQKIALQLPGFSKAVILEVKTALNLINKIDIVTYTGTVFEQKNSRFVLSVSAEEGLVGTINIGKHVYNIAPTDDFSRHIVAKTNKSMIPRNPANDVVESAAFEKVIQSKQSMTKSTNSNGLVKALFYVASDVSSPYSTILNTVAEMNTILANSQVNSNNRISITDIVAGISLNTTFPGKCIPNVLHEMRFRRGVFDDIDQKLQVYGADIAVTFIKGNTSSNPSHYCRVGGYAQLYGFSNNPSSPPGGSPFAVVADNYATSSGDLTAVHEIGHVLGGKEAIDIRDITPNSPLYARGFNYTSSNNDFQTIMGAYGGECAFNGPTSPYLCERIAKFSNPNLQHNNITIGATNNRDMKSWLNARMAGISNWTGDPLPRPAAPILSVLSDLCYGLNNLSWNAVSTATEYKLYKSTNLSFQNISLIYNGVNTSSFINVGSSTWYLRVKACNAAGCGNYSNQVTASSINSCL